MDADYNQYTPSAEQGATIKLAQAMPGLIGKNAKELGLDPNRTPQWGVQVDIQKFHSAAMNAVDLWIHIQFAEDYPIGGVESLSGHEVRDRFMRLLNERMAKLDLSGFDVAVDLFWGPGRGYILSGSRHQIDLVW